MFVRLFDKRFFAPENEDGTDAAIADAIEKVDSADDADDAIEDADDTADDVADDAGEPAADADDSAGTKSSNRRETRVQKLANDLKEEREARIRAEARAEERDRLRTAPQTDHNEARRIRQEKLDLMEPAERKTFLLEEQVASMQREQLIATIKTDDRIDKADFDAKVRANPNGPHAKLATRVEEVLGEMRRNGNNAPRATVFRYVLGEKAERDLEAASSKKQTVKEKEAAATRVTSAKAKPTSVRADGGSSKTGGEETLDQMKARILAREGRGDTV